MILPRCTSSVGGEGVAILLSLLLQQTRCVVLSRQITSPCRLMVCSICGLWTPTRYRP